MDDNLIIAIKIGTTHTEYCFNLTSGREKIDPHLKRWGKEFGQETPTTPTCILFDEHEQFISFGYEAKQSYLSISDQQARDMFFFDCFTLLYKNNLTKNLHIKAANGKEMRALKVFTEALRFLKDDALETINQNIGRLKLTASYFNWVLMVPDSCDPSIKPFMSEAATQAGMVTDGNEDNLVLALESEAALSYSMKLPAGAFIQETEKKLQDLRFPGNQHIVVVAEDEIIDFAVYEVLGGGRLKELYRSSVNDLGEKTVNRKFIEFLREIFTDKVWDEYERAYPSQVKRILYDFSRSKLADDNIMVSCPFNLSRLAQKHQDIEKLLEGVQGASWDYEMITISKCKLRSFFAQSLQGITHNVREIFNKSFNIDCILLVGKYAECDVLRRHITEEFMDVCKVLCPFRPTEPILKGAIVLGKHQRD